MTLSKKRQADEEPKPAHASKRRAAAPASTTTRLTRSAYRQLHARNDVAVELHPGLTSAPRKRKRAAAPTSTSASTSTTATADAQQPSAPPNAPSRSGSSAELEVLRPATTYVPPSKPCKQQQYARRPSVVYAPSATPDGQKICASINMEDLPETKIHPNSIANTFTAEAARESAANPGGPPRVAYMGDTVPLTIAYNATPARAHGDQHHRFAQRRISSHCSQISPLTGPVQSCVPPTPSLPGPPPSLTDVFRKPTTVGWSQLFHPGWVDGFVDNGDRKEPEMDGHCCKAPQDSPAPAIREAVYEVGSVEDAAALFETEMAAQTLEQCLELPVVHISVTKSPTDIFHEDMYFAQMAEHTQCPFYFEHGTGDADIDAMDWSTESECTGTGGSGHQATSECTHPPEHIETPLPSGKKAKLDFLPCMNPASSSCGSCEPVPDIAASTTVVERTESLSPVPPSTLLREKELRAQLIASRKARLLLRRILVRASDGTLSIASVDQSPSPSLPPSWSSQWQMDDDHYSVEEYDEDTVSY